MVLAKIRVRFLYYKTVLKSEEILSYFVPTAGTSLFVLDTPAYMLVVRKVKNVSAYNSRRRFIVPDQSFVVFSRV
jgi:hypothetical protein